MSAPAVTVVVPTYHRNDLLRAALRSVADQQYDGSVETVVVDSSPEGVAEPVVTAFDDVTYFKQVDFIPRVETATHNAAIARDIGISHATGEYVHFLDDDDELRPRAIARKLGHIREADRAAGAYSALERSDGEVHRVPEAVPGNELAYVLTTLKSPALPSTLLLRREVLLNCPPRRTLPHGDVGGLVEILLRTPLAYVDEPLTVRNRAPSVGRSVATAEARVGVHEKYAGLRTKLLTPAEQSTARATAEGLRRHAAARDSLDDEASDSRQESGDDTD